MEPKIKSIQVWWPDDSSTVFRIDDLVAREGVLWAMKEGLVVTVLNPSAFLWIDVHRE